MSLLKYNRSTCLMKILQFRGLRDSARHTGHYHLEAVASDQLKRWQDRFDNECKGLI